MARFFIDRPVFAWVIAILIMGLGLLSIRSLPVAQYPEIAPPGVTVQATYPGASAETVESTVIQVLEQALTGLDGLRYMSSSSNSAGSAQISLSVKSRHCAQWPIWSSASASTPARRLPPSRSRSSRW